MESQESCSRHFATHRTHPAPHVARSRLRRLRRRALPVAALLAALLALGGCSAPGGYDVRTQFDPAVVTLPAQDDGVTVTFTVPAGAKAGYVTGYEVTYLDATGEPVLEEGSTFEGSSVALRLPAGNDCEPFTVCPPSSYVPKTSDPLTLPKVPNVISAAYAVTETGRGTARYTWTAELDDGRSASWTSSLQLLVDFEVSYDPVVSFVSLTDAQAVMPNHAFGVRIDLPAGRPLEQVEAALNGVPVVLPSVTATDVVLNTTFPGVTAGMAKLVVTATDVDERVGTGSVEFTVSTVDALP
mgnify:CR=1 FL=1